MRKGVCRGSPASLPSMLALASRGKGQRVTTRRQLGNGGWCPACRFGAGRGPRASLLGAVARGLGLLGVSRLSLVALVVLASPGCSLILTKGPEPALQPMPECTTSVAAPVTDTVLAAASVALAVAALVAANASTPSCSGQNGFGCGLGNGATGAGDVVAALSAGLGVLFGVSAGVGYTRTAACRASLGPDFVLPKASSAPPPETSLWHPDAGRGCASVSADAPRVCPSVSALEASWMR
jgi:hypothetical protein